MKNIFLILFFLTTYLAQAQQYVLTVLKDGSDIKVYIQESTGTPFLLGPSDIFINSGGLVYTLAGVPPFSPVTATNNLLAPYSVDVIETAPGDLAISILNLGMGAPLSINIVPRLIATISVTGAGVPTLSGGNNIANTAGTQIALGAAAPLPVELLSFTAEKSGDKSLIQWQTVSERDLETFIVERSENGVQFAPIGSVVPKAKSENEKATYSLVDEKPALGVNYYRLQSKDWGKKGKFSNIVSVDFGVGVKTKAFPNPFTADLNVEIDVEQSISGDVLIDLFDTVGKLVLSKKIVAEGRKLNFTVPTEKLAAGSYVVRIKNGNYTWKHTITKQ